ncbi:AAA family ATPase [Kineococcus radiotolerans]|uniref:Uncharacterized protein n=1 Tax=Kineococcus radiotolerans (strain ATCC BAA-149 / DSM 14245 / SRS30216) TaxID=266940 RepID=A6WH71_KINRD|nr:AAA family ATPase [Kineococcus radiotolerans]ABS06160.1 hypothetical protein Krad_4702 [Kineococcus radiotolerans SRS30216 = ATCC BAA-149]
MSAVEPVSYLPQHDGAQFLQHVQSLVPPGFLVSLTGAFPDRAVPWTVHLDTAEQAEAIASSWSSAASSVWLRVCSQRQRPERGRGGDTASAVLPGAWFDGDTLLAHETPEREDGLVLPRDSEQLAQLFSQVLPPPSLLVDSGHGQHPYLLLEHPELIDDGNRAAVAALLRRLGEGVARGFAAQGFVYDPKPHDLARVLGAAGTVSRKPGRRPVLRRILLADGPRYTLAHLQQWSADLDARHPVSVSRTPPSAFSVGAPARSAPTTNTGRFLADETGGGTNLLETLAAHLSVREVLEAAGWTAVAQSPTGELQWRRPGNPSNPVSGHSGHDGHDVFVNWSDNADLPTGVGLNVPRLLSHLAGFGGDLSAFCHKLQPALNGVPGAATFGIPAHVVAVLQERHVQRRGSRASSPLPAAALPLALLQHRHDVTADAERGRENAGLDSGEDTGPHAGEDGGEPVRATWAPVDLAAVVAGEHVVPVAEFMPRTDGVGLLYAGRVHSLAGEPESGKSLLAQAEVARVLAAGGSAVYIDGEDTPGNVVARLLAMGAPAEVLTGERFRYVRPEVSPGVLSEAQAWQQLLAQPVDMVVIDGVTEFLGLAGASSKDGDDVTAWMRGVPRRIARETGAAVVLIDHVTKDRDTRGRWAIGSQAKLAACDAAYIVEPKLPLGRGMRGLVVVRVAKDRPGGVRPHAAMPWRASDRTAEVARVSVDSSDGEAIRVVVDPPAVGGESGEDDGPGVGHSGGGSRLTGYMERLSKVLEASPEPLTTNLLTKDTDVMRGRPQYRSQALATLVAEGYVAATPGPGRSQLHRSVRSYREAQDPRSDQFDGGNHLSPAGGSEGGAAPVVPGSPSSTGEPGNHLEGSGWVVPGTAGEPPGNHREPPTEDTVEDDQ